MPADSVSLDLSGGDASLGVEIAQVELDGSVVQSFHFNTDTAGEDLNRTQGTQGLKAKHKDHVWSYDFVFDRTEDGRTLKILAIVLRLSETILKRSSK